MGFRAVRAVHCSGRELRNIEQRLVDAGAVKNGDGVWQWRNEDGSTSTFTVDG